MLLREFFATLGLNIKEQEFAKGELAAAAVKASLEKLVDVVKESAEAFFENVKGVVEYGDELNKAAQASGIARDALQELRYVAKLADVSNEEFTASLNVLTRTMRAARDGSDEQGKAFHKLGIRVTDAHGKLRNADDVISDIAQGLSKMPDGAEKSALAMQFFGRAGARMIPLLNQGAAGIEQLRQEARELGLVMDDEAVKASEELNDNLTRLKVVGQGLWRQAIAPLIPAINELVVRFLKWRKENAAIMAQRIQRYVGYVIKAVRGLSDAFSFLVRNAAAVKAIVITGLVYGFAQLEIAAVGAALKTAGAWLLAAAPFVALAALIAGILLVFDDIRVYQHGGKSLYGRFKKEIEDWLKPRKEDPWFVVAIKDFVRLLHDALELIDEFYKATGRSDPRTVDKQAGKSDRQVKYDTAVQTQRAARVRAQLGLPLTPEQVKAIEFTGGTEQSFNQRYGAKGPLPAPTSEQIQSQAQGPIYYRPDTPTPLRSGPSTYAPQFTIVQQPGEDSEALVRKIDERIEEHWDGKMEDAAAAVGP